MPSIAEILANLRKQQEAEKKAVEEKLSQEQNKREQKLQQLKDACNALMAKCGAAEILEELNIAILNGKGEVNKRSGVGYCEHDISDYRRDTFSFYYSAVELNWPKDRAEGERKGILVGTSFHLEGDLESREINLHVRSSHNRLESWCPSAFYGHIPNKKTSRNDISEAVAKVFLELEKS